MFRQVLRVAWAPLAVVLLHAVLARTVGNSRALNPFFHFFGGAAGAYAVLTAVAHFPHLRAWLPFRKLTLAAVAVTTIAALVWEVGEFVGDRVLRMRAQMGWRDTIIDLVCGIGGAWFSALVIRGWRRDTVPSPTELN